MQHADDDNKVHAYDYLGVFVCTFIVFMCVFLH